MQFARTLNNLLLGVAALWAVNSTAAEWFVDKDATGSRNGTSWANAWTNLNGITGTAAGDTIYISGGTTSKTYRDPFWKPSNGTAGNRKTYSIGQEAGHNGIAIFDAQGANVSWLYDNIKHVNINGLVGTTKSFFVTNCTGASVDLSGCSDVTIEGVISSTQWLFNPCTNVYIGHSDIKGAPVGSTAGATYVINLISRFPAGDSPSYTNNSVYNCIIRMPSSDTTPAWGSDGIKSGSYCTMSSNQFEVYYVTNNTEWEHTDGIQNLTPAWVKVHSSSFNNIANYGVFMEMTVAGTNLWVYNNIFKQTDTLAHAQQQHRAIAIGQRTPGSTVQSIYVMNNTVVDTFGATAISLGDDPSESSTWVDVIIANNLLYNSGKPGSDAILVYRGDGLTNGISILYNKAITGARGTNSVMPSQLAAAGGDTSLALASYTERSAANDFHLQSTDTAAKDSGFDLSSYFTTDADGNTRSGTWDLGAFEWLNTLIIFTNNASGSRMMGFRGLGMRP